MELSPQLHVKWQGGLDCLVERDNSGFKTCDGAETGGMACPANGEEMFNGGTICFAKVVSILTYD